MRDRVLEELNAHLRKEEEYEKSLPKCAYCGEPIQDDYCFKINGEVICEDCCNDNFRHNTEEFMD